MPRNKEFKTNVYCCVPQCNQYYDKNISFHYFPRNNKLYYAEWVRALKIGKPVTQSMRVCSRHFTDEDFFFKSHVNQIPRLKKNAVPTKNLPQRSHETKRNEELSKRSFRVKHRHELHELLSCKQNIKMTGCSAVNCTNSSKKGFVMKRFPKDPVRRRQWLEKVQRDNWILTDYCCLCEVHFAPEMWEKDRVDGKRKLRCNAVPTIFPEFPQTKPKNPKTKTVLRRPHVPKILPDPVKVEIIDDSSNNEPQPPNWSDNILHIESELQSDNAMRILLWPPQPKIIEPPTKRVFLRPLLPKILPASEKVNIDKSSRIEPQTTLDDEDTIILQTTFPEEIVHQSTTENSGSESQKGQTDKKDMEYTLLSSRIMYVCKVPQCNNAARRNAFNELRFYHFPKEPERRKLWKKFCNIGKEVSNCDNYRICEEHFEEKFIMASGRLFPTAVPTRKKPDCNASSSDSDGDNSRIVAEDHPYAANSSINVEDDNTENDDCEVNTEVCTDFRIQTNGDTKNYDQVDIISKEISNNSKSELGVDVSASEKELKPVVQKPYFKSLKSFLLDTRSLADVCRVCFHSVSDGEITRLSVDSSSHIKEIVISVLPDLNLEMCPDVVICTKCVELIERSHQLKQMFSSTQKKLHRIIEQKKGVTNKDADLIIVMQKATEESTKGVSLPKKGNLQMTTSILKNLTTSGENPSKFSVFYGGLNGTDPVPVLVQQKNDNKDVYTCFKCDRTFAYLSHFKSHRCVYQTNSNLMCEKCGTLVSSEKWLSHRRIHYRERGANAVYKCTSCNLSFRGRGKWYYHKNKVHRRRVAQCHICGKRYPYPGGLSQHLRYHNPKTRNKRCNICDKTFFTNHTLEMHLTSHLGKNLFKCDECGRSYCSKITLAKHKKVIHMKQSKYFCEICEKPFVAKQGFERHNVFFH